MPTQPVMQLRMISSTRRAERCELLPGEIDMYTANIVVTRRQNNARTVVGRRLRMRWDRCGSALRGSSTQTLRPIGTPARGDLNVRACCLMAAEGCCGTTSGLLGR